MTRAALGSALAALDIAPLLPWQVWAGLIAWIACGVAFGCVWGMWCRAGSR